MSLFGTQYAIRRTSSRPRVELAGIIDDLVFENSRLKYLPHAFPAGGKTRDDAGFAAQFFSCPIPAWDLPKKGQPFVLDQLGGYRQKTLLCFTPNDLGCPVLGRMWREADISLWCNFLLSGTEYSVLETRSKTDKDGTALVDLDYYGDGDGREVIQDFSRAAKFAEDGLSARPPRRGVERFSGLGKALHFERLQEAIDRLGDLFREIRFELWLEADVSKQSGTTEHDTLRPVLNGLSRSWTTSFSAFYRDGFDPFGHFPDIPDDIGEIRFPVLRLEGQVADEPKLQVDVIHESDSTVLEFISASGVALLNRYAKQAGIDFE